MKRKLSWRFRKGSEADPIKVKECGCKYYVYTGQVVRHCEEHKSKKATEPCANKDCDLHSPEDQDCFADCAIHSLNDAINCENYKPIQKTEKE